MIEYINAYQRETVTYTGEAKVLLDGGLRVFSSESDSDRLRAALENDAVVLSAIALIAACAEGENFTSVLRMEIESPDLDPGEPPDSEHIESHTFEAGMPTYIEFTYPPQPDSPAKETAKTVIRYRPQYGQPSLVAPSGSMISTV